MPEPMKPLLTTCLCLRVQGNPGQVLLIQANKLSSYQAINLGHGLVLEQQQIDLLPHYAIMNSLSTYQALFSPRPLPGQHSRVLRICPGTRYSFVKQLLRMLSSSIYLASTLDGPSGSRRQHSTWQMADGRWL
jgi:hypothetical protein